MERREFPGGVWPVMIVPFREDGSVDLDAYDAIVPYYLTRGCQGLFAVCQSTEMDHLTLEERLAVAKKVKSAAGEAVPVIAVGNLEKGPEAQAREVRAFREAGADAVILVTNAFAAERESDDVWLENCMDLMSRIPEDIPLGFYECPVPYKRLISTENLKRLADTGRFYFLKDTCCDEALIEERLRVLQGTNLKLYNANTSTLRDSLLAGAHGFSGVMANFHPELYVKLTEDPAAQGMEILQSWLTMASLIERQYYPVNAKYHMARFEGVPIRPDSRRLDAAGFSATMRSEVDQLAVLEKQVRAKFLG